jgi:hypothetical protein
VGIYLKKATSLIKGESMCEYCGCDFEKECKSEDGCKVNEDKTIKQELKDYFDKPRTTLCPPSAEELVARLGKAPQTNDKGNVRVSVPNPPIAMVGSLGGVPGDLPLDVKGQMQKMQKIADYYRELSRGKNILIASLKQEIDVLRHRESVNVSALVSQEISTDAEYVKLLKDLNTPFVEQLEKMFNAKEK